MTTALTVSTSQYTALDGGIAANVLEHIRLIEDAADHGARLVVFPELSRTGYAAGEDHRLALHLGARAMDNRMFSVLANLGGSTQFGPSAGGSGFWGPDGLVIRQAAGTGTEVVTATLRHDVLDRYDDERGAGRRPVPEPRRPRRG